MSNLNKIKSVSEKELYFFKNAETNCKFIFLELTAVDTKWCQKLKEILLLNCIFLQKRKLNYQSWKKAGVLTYQGLHIVESLTTGTVFSVSF